MASKPAVTSSLCRVSVLLLMTMPISLSSTVVRAERLPIRPYTVADGLAHNEINKIVRDSRGFLWFCTVDGLSRFDGYKFTNFGSDQGLPNANVNDLLETSNGDYWLATSGGLVHFNPAGAASKQVNYDSEQDPQFASLFTVIIPSNNDTQARAISVLLEDHNRNIWCGTSNGLYKLERSNHRFELRPVDVGMPTDHSERSFVADLLEDDRQSLWVATPGGLYRRWPDGSAAHYTKHEGLPNEYLQDLLQDHQGQLWVGTKLGGFFRVVVDNSHAAPMFDSRFTMNEGLPSDWIFQLFETSNHKFWVATAKGLVEFFPNGDEKGRRFHSYNERNGLSYHDITTVNEDLAGNLWLGTNTSGAMKFARNGFITYDSQDGLYSVNAVFEGNRGVCFRGYVVSDGDKSVFEGAKFDLLHSPAGQAVTRFGQFNGQEFTWFLPDALKKAWVGWVSEGLTMQSRSGEWWIGTGAGLFRFPAVDDFTQIQNLRPLTVYSINDGLAAWQVFRIFEDSHGDVWVSTISGAGNGLAHWDRASGNMRDLSGMPGLPSLKDDLPRSFGEDGKGNIWIGFNRGIARYANGSFRFFSALDGLPPGGIMNIYRDGAGRMWLASSRTGLIRVDNLNSERPVFTSYTTHEGLSSNNTEVISEDRAGHIYVGGGSGLDRFDPVNGRIKHFTTSDGLAEGSLRAAFRDRNGTLWFGTARGLSRFTPEPDDPTKPPPILISTLQVNNERWPVSALGEREMVLPQLAANQNQLQIEFVALGFATGEVMHYQYKLERADTDWSVPTEQRTVNYAQLASGHYRFVVRAVNSDGTISATPATISFTILPHIYQRWWFLTLAALSVGLIGLSLYRSRVARLVGIERVRTRIAADLHDDIGTNLTRIAILSEVAHQQVNPTDSVVAGPLGAIARISRESVASMSDIVWAVNPRRDSLLDVLLRMRRFANEILFGSNIEFQFDAPTIAEDLKLGANLRRDIFLIFKEALNNAVRHSGCTKVTIGLHLERSWLRLRLSDDGCGFEPSRLSEGHGLISMQRRAKALNGKLEFQSRPGEGTDVLLQVPYRQ